MLSIIVSSFSLSSSGIINFLRLVMKWVLSAMKILFLCFLLFYPLYVSANNFDVPGCGNLSNAYGPFDYTNPYHYGQKLKIVEGAHFSPEIERLIERKGKNRVIDDLDYTLRAFPNHHRALMSVARYRILNPWKYGERFKSADCYFKRALALNPNDANVYMIYGIYKHKLKKYDEAEKLYLKALVFIPDSAELQYNIGLLYFAKQDYDKAKKFAKEAYRQNFPLKGLENKLKKNGVW